jgi:hypothetical protein
MSANTIVNRSALFAAVTALGTAGFLAAPPAHAESCKVNESQLQLIVHPPGLTYTVTVSANGSTLSGNVHSTHKNQDGASGNAAGGIAGNSVNFIVDWFPSNGGGMTHFRGTVGSDGVAHGTATGSSAKNFSGGIEFEPGPWDSVKPLSCVAVQTGPPAGEPPKPAELPKQGPTVSADPGLAGVTFTITDRSGVAAQCTYSSEGFESSFALPANGSHDLFVPAVRLFKNRTGKVTCDNGTSTPTSVFY